MLRRLLVFGQPQYYLTLGPAKINFTASRLSMLEGLGPELEGCMWPMFFSCLGVYPIDTPVGAHDRHVRAV